MIPKIIHYCWFGDTPIKQEYIEYIKEWLKFNPSFKIKEWNNENIPSNIPYLKLAIEQKNWANASNYIRLYALRTEGGIYMDTDMKVLGSLDSLLEHQAFLGFESGSLNSSEFWVNNAIMGAVPNHDFIKECESILLETYNGTEKANLSAPHLITNVLKNSYGLCNYGYQFLKNIVLFEKEVFYPLPYEKAYLRKNSSEWGITSNTLAIHMWGRSWFSQDMMLDLVDYYQSLKVEQEHINIDLRNQIIKSQIDLQTKISEVNTIKEESKQLKVSLNIIEDLSIYCKNQFQAFNAELNDHKTAFTNHQVSISEISHQLRELESDKPKHVSYFETISQKQQSLLEKLEDLSQNLKKVEAIDAKTKELASAIIEIQKTQSEEYGNSTKQSDSLTKLQQTVEQIGLSVQPMKVSFLNYFEKLESKSDDTIQQLNNLTKYVIEINKAFKNSETKLENEINGLKEKNLAQNEAFDYLSQQNQELNQIILDYKIQYEDASILTIVLRRIFNKRKN